MTFNDTSTPTKALCYFTECELATLEGLRIVKRTSKSELARHESLAKSMVDTVKRLCPLKMLGIAHGSSASWTHHRASPRFDTDDVL